MLEIAVNAARAADRFGPVVRNVRRGAVGGLGENLDQKALACPPASFILWGRRGRLRLR